MSTSNTNLTTVSENPNNSFESKNQSLLQSFRPLMSLWPYMMKYKARIIFAIMVLLIAAGATLVFPIAIRQMIDLGFRADNSGFIDQYFIALIFVCAILAITSSLRLYLVVWIGERIISDVRNNVFSHIARLDLNFFDKSKSGEIISRLSADTTQIKSVVGVSASIALRNMILCIGATIMMFVTSPRLSSFVLLSIPIIVIPLIFLGRMVQKKSRTAQDMLANAISYANEAIGSIRILKAYTYESKASNHYKSAVENSFTSSILATAARAFLTGFAILIISSSVVVVLWIGAQDVLANKLSPGTLSQFLLFSVMAAGALGALSQVWGEFALASGATERLMELLATPITIKSPTNPEKIPSPVKGQIDFSKVTFCYENRPDTKILENFDLTIQPGETLAIVGPSGSGKSTLFSLLMRYYDPISGIIAIDNIPLTRMEPSEIRKHIAIVPQETFIFAASAEENIRYGNPNATIEEIENAAKLALADNFIRALPNDYQSLIGEKGVTLSGGQRQRIAIARAILKNAPILLLDEATNSLDTESEKSVQTALERLMKNRTTLIIAHRLSTVRNANKIVVMDNGKIVESGTHENLQAAGGLYEHLNRIQFEPNVH